MTNTSHPQARFDDAAMAVVVEQMTIRNTDVVHEGKRWTAGERGPLVEDVGRLAGADLTNYVTEALRIGAHALSVTGQAQEGRVLESMLKEVGDKTAASTARAGEVTARAVKEASEAVSNAAIEAKKSIAEVDAQHRKDFTEAVTGAKRELTGEVSRLFGGERPELLERLRPLLEKFGTDLDAKVSAGTSELLAKAARQFDPADPTSPMAKHAADLSARQEALTKRLNEHHAELAGKVEELATALRLRETRVELAKVTPLKGDVYAAQIHTVMSGIAGGLGDEYVDTSTVPGQLPRCKKGDGVLTINGGAARVVLEMTDSVRNGWGEYLDQAERNRDAAASLGLVRTADQNRGQTVRVIGSRRIVLAFDPEAGEADLLRTVVLLLRTMALAAVSRKGEYEIATAEEKIAEALVQLAKIDSVKKLAGTIEKNAQKIDGQCVSFSSGIRRLLDQALTALAGIDPTAAVEVADGAA